MNKLYNFPPVNFISVDYSVDRRKNLYKKFLEYNIANIKPHIFKKYDENNHKIITNSVLSNDNNAATTSHLRTIKSWYYGTDEPYAFFCEDDLSLETVKYWNFTWEEFFNNLPKDWGVVQLSLLRNNFHAFLIKFRTRCWCDWSCCAYIMKRDFAKKLIDTYFPKDEYLLNLVSIDAHIRPYWASHPCVETLIYSSMDTPIYMAPLFVENIRFAPSYKSPEEQTEINELDDHVYSYNECLKWWKSIGTKISLDEFMKI